VITSKIGQITRNQRPNAKKILNLKKQDPEDIFMVRGAGWKPEWKITAKIVFLLDSPPLA